MVADWVMRMFFSDCREIAGSNDVYSEIISDINDSIKLYTFLLQYTEPTDLHKMKILQKLIQEVIQFNENRDLKPDWDEGAFVVYRKKLNELDDLLRDELAP
ncbi:hypothetical protein CRP01_33510 [Flavilitoribacter nigricans DSM 23189 = NBRC 102662]|uniref:Uncharacterized protein n=1 Tax=Flavilitoribacter nigricans (strain ATCC 23147 / DSM 23189 / NBRC 102662 / NCIMB 1420 / SS-2) TaxID=1122177 RepID=A0A2D0N1U9_FLAN2|nr:hypothetical protein CRP01_33510 [Flavilitoribacter nigricans DSM 23189 = NBRC 102662]